MSEDKNRILLYVVAGISLIIGHAALASIILYVTQGWHIEDYKPWHIYSYGIDMIRIEKYRFWLILAYFAPILAILVIIAYGPAYKPKSIFGDAHFSSKREAKKAGILHKDGVLLGKAHGSYLCSDTVTHSLLIGPTRAGKGTGIIIPNCLNWKGSLVVLDVKGENYRITSGFRKAHGHETYFWQPLAHDAKSHKYNPLDSVSKHPAHRVTDVQKISTLLVEVSEKDQMWGQEARALFVGMTLFVLEKRETKTLGEVYRLISEAGDLRTVADFIIRMNPDLSDECKRPLASFAAKSPKEASSVRSTLQSGLRLFENPLLDEATSSSDFKLDDLRRKKISVYVGILPSELELAAPIIRLFFQQVIAILSQREPQEDEPHKVLMLLDEMASLGNMNAVVQAFTLLAGYNVRIMAVIQGLSWLDRIYGKDTREGIISCCGLQVIMTTNDEITGQYASRALGERTVKNTSQTRRTFSWEHQSPSKNMSGIGRPLMTPQEFRGMKRTEQIVLVEGHPPTKAKKIQYFKDKAFTPRLLPATAVPELSALPVKRKPLMPPKTSQQASTDDEGIDHSSNNNPQDNEETTNNAGQQTVNATAKQLEYEQMQMEQLFLIKAEAADNEAYAEKYADFIKELEETLGLVEMD